MRVNVRFMLDANVLSTAKMTDLLSTFDIGPLFYKWSEDKEVYAVPTSLRYVIITFYYWILL